MYQRGFLVNARRFSGFLKKGIIDDQCSSHMHTYVYCDAFVNARSKSSRVEERREDGLRLRDCYVTVSARCAPPGNEPTRLELEHCHPYLVAEVGLLGRVEVVITLGRIAHDAWLRAAGW